MSGTVGCLTLALRCNMCFLNRLIISFAIIAYCVILSESAALQSMTSFHQKRVECRNRFTCTENSTNFKNAESCGLKPKGDTLLLKGIVSVVEFPWLTAVINVNLGEVICTGTLISPRYVLSSAKCLSLYLDPFPKFNVELKSFDNKSGANCTTLDTDIRLCDKHINFSVQEVTIHPSYDSKTGLNDIALLRLDGLVSFESYQLPICLPTTGINLVQPGDTLSVVGWNKTPIRLELPLSEQERISSTLVSEQECTNAFNMTGSIPANYMCTSKPDDVHDCDAIIGNPVILFDDSRWHLEGFVHSCSNDFGLIITTRVQSFMKWIGDYAKNESCTIPNGEAGELKYLSDCPPLLHAFANPRKHSAEYLNKYLYKSGNEFMITLTPPIVCCGTSSNFTAFDPESFPPIVNGSNNPIQDISIFKYCGIQLRDGYVSEDENITTDEFPWVAAIHKVEEDHLQKKQFQYLTTGGLINRIYVLTGSGNIIALQAENLFVRLGEYYTTGDDDCSVVPELGLKECSEVLDYGVEETIIHPMYYISRGLTNLALLRLNKSVTFTDYIRPICLPTPNFNLMKSGDTLYSTGWANKKKKVATSLISNDECKERHTSFNDLITISLNNFCTRDFRNGSEFTCIGDEGAPVMFSSSRHQWFLIGISANYVCNETEPQIHTKVAGYLEWIYSVINS